MPFALLGRRLEHEPDGKFLHLRGTPPWSVVDVDRSRNHLASIANDFGARPRNAHSRSSSRAFSVSRNRAALAPSTTR
jgi:hypothetical protein